MTGHDNSIDRVLATAGCAVPASVFDPMTGRMAVELGYPCAILPGSSAALHHLGAPDITLISQDAVVDLCRRITRVMAIPLIVDGDHGFGNALNARHFAGELARAGAAAVTIEDTVLPRPLSRGADPGIPLAEACAKIRAAVDGAGTSGLRVIARTSTAVCPDSASLIDRLRAFEQTGAVALFVSGLGDWATLDAVAAKVSLPLVLGARAPALEDLPRLTATGVRIALACQSVSQAAYRGAWDQLAAQAPAGIAAPSDFAALLDRLSGGPDYRAQTHRYGTEPANEPSHRAPTDRKAAE
jgi:carboxyvinyl-carboxyphosphonate phosphorylmutase